MEQNFKTMYDDISRNTVRAMLERWPTAQVAAQLAAWGFDKDMVREEFRAAFKQRLADSASEGQCNDK